MDPYKNLNGNSPITAYELGPDFIRVQFPNRSYLYTDESAGKENVEEMKRRAIEGRGLASFISQNRLVHFGYVPD